MSKHTKPDIPFEVAVPLRATREGMIVTLRAEPEDSMSMRHQFINKCGWTRAEFRKIETYKWFRVEVSAWYDGECLSTEHLGCCCYKTVREFLKESGYFSDMEATVRKEARRILKDRTS